MIVIKRIGVLQLAKIMGLVYFLMTAIFCIPMGVFVMLMGVFQGEHRLMGGVIGGIGMGVASVAGGIELELER